MTITLKFKFVEGGGKTKTYKTLAGAQKAAHRQIGAHPEIGRSYAVDGWGCCTLRVQGCSLEDLFPPHWSLVCPRMNYRQEY